MQLNFVQFPKLVISDHCIYAPLAYSYFSLENIRVTSAGNGQLSYLRRGKEEEDGRKIGKIGKKIHISHFMTQSAHHF